MHRRSALTRSAPAKSRRTLIAAVVAVIAGGGVVVGCGQTGDPVATPAPPAVDLVAMAVAPTTTAAAIPVTTPGPRPLLPHESLVADVRPEISVLTVHDAPNGTPFLPELTMRNPWYFGGQLSLLVTSGRETDAWVEVALPSRPNGLRGWIRSSDVTFRTHRWRIVVSVGERMVRAYDADTLMLETSVVVGRSSTPTPLGRFFVNAEIPQANPGGGYGPLILSVSSFSEVLESFDGGLPEIALHGTNQPGLIGQAVSNGCVRLTNDQILRLADLVPVGTPVEFVA